MSSQSDQSDVSRRDFLKASAKATSGIVALQGITFLARPKRIFGANDRVRVAVCGLHGRGKDHLAGFGRVPNVEIAALCDVDENVLNKARGEVSGNAQTFVDVRKLLEDKSIDALSIATPNHWHALIAIWACQAGKDVYVEKPCSHNLWEGRQLVLAAQKYSRIVQHGTQIRSAPAIREAMQKLQEGLVGDVYLARGLCFKWRDTIGRAPVEPRWRLERRQPGRSWRLQYDFSLLPRHLSAFAGMCWYHQTSPDSHFTRNRVYSLATPNGRVTLSGIRLIVTSNGRKEEQVLAAEADWHAALRDHFGIVLDQEAPEQQRIGESS
jgi:N-acetyltransferase/Oxidoreductase family, NAD-binding Rossmann fold